MSGVFKKEHYVQRPWSARNIFRARTKEKGREGREGNGAEGKGVEWNRREWNSGLKQSARANIYMTVEELVALAKKVADKRNVKFRCSQVLREKMLIGIDKISSMAKNLKNEERPGPPLHTTYFTPYSIRGKPSKSEAGMLFHIAAI